MPGQAVSKGQVYPIFVGLLTKLKEDAVRLATAGSAPRIWQLPPSFSYSPTNVSGIENLFARGDMNSGFSSLIDSGSSPGTAGDAISVKTQIDYTAAMERAFRARHATPIRCLAHAAARRHGHGHEAGIFGDTTGVMRFVSDAIAAGRD